MLGTWDSYGTISIHALLAESDGSFCPADSCGWHFYPRSPCGERRSEGTTATSAGIFLSTLSLRRATLAMAGYTKAEIISIHALLAESDYTAIVCAPPTLNFYPRSPCGERRSEGTTATSRATFLSTLSLRRATRWPVPAEKGSSISIHALLAESDGPRLSSICPTRLFLSTLSLRRATYRRLQLIKALKFLSTLSLRRATD